MRVCSEPGCPTLVDNSGRCIAHKREADRRRGNRHDRGYDSTHVSARATALPNAYGKPCPMCGHTMQADQALALDHTPDRTGYRGIAHLSCNARDGAQRGNTQRHI